MKLATDYKNNDWIKLSLSLIFIFSLLIIGVTTYLDSFLIPGLEGLPQILELSADWLEEYAQERADTISERLKMELDRQNILGIIDTGIDDVNNKANQIFVVWIAMGIGLLVPIYFIVKAVLWSAKKFDKLIKFDTTKRAFYFVRENKTQNRKL